VNSLALTDVSVRFGAVQALAGVDVTVDRGEVVMLVGPNGAGKTTLARVVLGLVKPQRGTMKIDGREHPVNNQFKEQLGYLPEAVAFSENLRGRQVLRFFAWARGVPSTRIDAALDRVGLRDAARRPVRGYSRGMRQRLGIAVAILSEPELLILDEPTGGLDQEGLAVLWSVIAEWRDKRRMVLLSSHQLALLERRIDRLCVFKAGKVIATGTPAALRDEAGVRQRVRLQLSPSETTSVEALCAEVLAWDGADSRRDGDLLLCDIRGHALLGLMDLRGKHPTAVTGISIEEPTLELVYERLLEDA
jgi:Cu-processing system ATP-binding protein